MAEVKDAVDPDWTMIAGSMRNLQQMDEMLDISSDDCEQRTFNFSVLLDDLSSIKW